MKGYWYWWCGWEKRGLIVWGYVKVGYFLLELMVLTSPNPSEVSTTFFLLVSEEEKVESGHKLLDMPSSTLNKA